MIARLWRGRVVNTVVRVRVIDAGVAQPVAGLGAEGVAAGRALGSAEQALVAGRGIARSRVIAFENIGVQNFVFCFRIR